MSPRYAIWRGWERSGFEVAVALHRDLGQRVDLGHRQIETYEVVVEPWDDEAWARGAASLLLGELFQPALRPGEDDRPSLTART